MTNALQSHVTPVEPQIIPAPPLRIVMVEEPAKSVLPEKRAFHDFVIFHAFPHSSMYCAPNQEPIVQPQAFRAGSPLKPDALDRLGKHGCQIGVSLRLGHHT